MQVDEQRADTTPYGDVPYADPGYQPDHVKRYPIDCEHVQAAWSYINQADNQRPYTAEQLAAIKSRIEAAMRRCGHEVSTDAGRSTGGDIERRYTQGIVQPGEVRGHITGYAAMYNKPSRGLAMEGRGQFIEQVLPSAFAEQRGRGWPNIIARFEHTNMFLLGTTGGGTLQLRSDEVGLNYSVRPPNSRADVIELVERGDVRHSSFAFRVPKGGDEWTYERGFPPQRSLVKVQLIDVAPVVEPAYPDTTAAMRSLARYAECEVNEVVERAQRDELRSFFVRTDVEGQSKPRKFGTALLAEHLGTQRDPWS